MSSAIAHPAFKARKYWDTDISSPHSQDARYSLSTLYLLTCNCTNCKHIVLFSHGRFYHIPPYYTSPYPTYLPKMFTEKGSSLIERKKSKENKQPSVFWGAI